MRVITGIYKGRHFDIPHTFKARPTTDMAKENIFNTLQGMVQWDGAVALDLFAGTGSISLELLSRGCQSVTSVELDRDHARFIAECVRKLGDTHHTLVRGDVFRFIERCHQSFDFIFADPPYTLPQLAELPDRILQSGLLREGGLLVFEHGKNHHFNQHPCWVDHRQYGSVNFSLFRPKANAAAEAMQG